MDAAFVYERTEGHCLRPPKQLLACRSVLLRPLTFTAKSYRGFQRDNPMCLQVSDRENFVIRLCGARICNTVEYEMSE